MTTPIKWSSFTHHHMFTDTSTVTQNFTSGDLSKIILLIWRFWIIFLHYAMFLVVKFFTGNVSDSKFTDLVFTH